MFRSLESSRERNKETARKHNVLWNHEGQILKETGSRKWQSPDKNSRDALHEGLIASWGNSKWKAIATWEAQHARIFFKIAELKENIIQNSETWYLWPDCAQISKELSECIQCHSASIYWCVKSALQGLSHTVVVMLKWDNIFYFRNISISFYIHFQTSINISWHPLSRTLAIISLSSLHPNGPLSLTYAPPCRLKDLYKINTRYSHTST